MTDPTRPSKAREPATEPAAASPDPRAVLVTVLGANEDGPPPMVVDSAGHGASLDRHGGERATLREGPDGPTHRLLLLTPTLPAAGSPQGVERREVVVDGWRFELDVESAARAALRERASRGRVEVGQSGPTRVHAIIPGVVVSVSVAPGDEVIAGQQLLVVEAMKMQNELRAPRDGTIEQVAVGAGATIDVGDLLLVLA
jgi:biotin carboxyl carrier protein